MVSGTPLKKTHSLCNTSVSPIKNAGYLNSHIKHLTGHNTGYNRDKYLEAYDLRDDGELFDLLPAISNETHFKKIASMYPCIHLREKTLLES